MVALESDVIRNFWENHVKVGIVFVPNCEHGLQREDNTDRFPRWDTKWISSHSLRDLASIVESSLSDSSSEFTNTVSLNKV